MEDKYNLKKNAGKFLLGVVLIIIVVAGFWYFGREEKNTRVQTTEEAVEVLSRTPQVQIETNPIKKVPDINPVEKTNPFKTTNPFK